MGTGGRAVALPKARLDEPRNRVPKWQPFPGAALATLRSARLGCGIKSATNLRSVNVKPKPQPSSALEHL